jgi:hydroxyacylglutathione hydrolase
VSKLYFRQVKEIGDNFSYVIADSNYAIVVDPSYNASQLIQLIENLDRPLKFIINTHHHRDHTAGNNQVKNHFHCQIIAHHLSGIDKDREVDDNDLITIGELALHVIHTPGHTPDSICLLIDHKLLTGDTLFVGECGRTDLMEGNSQDMYYSLFHKLLKLPDATKIYPGHDYGPTPVSTVGNERKTNYTLKPRTVSDFIEFMKTP